jgi:hypothetical protein
MPQNTHATITTERLDLLTVAGQVDLDGLGRLPSGLTTCSPPRRGWSWRTCPECLGADGGLFDLGAPTNQLLGCRGGWLQLVGQARRC